MKKLLTMLAFMLFSSNAFALAVTQEPIFKDITNNDYKDAIIYLYNNGVVSGYDTGDFKPDNTINRAEFTKILIESNFNDEEISGSNCFKDVSDEWFAKYICTAKNKGIVKGYDTGEFKPAQNISFVEAAKIISSLMGNATESENVWYENYVMELSDDNVIPTSIKDLSKEITRGEMSEMIWRLLEKVNTKPSMEFSNNKLISYVPNFTDDYTEFKNNFFSLKTDKILSTVSSGSPSSVMIEHHVNAENNVAAICDTRGDAEASYELSDFKMTVNSLSMNLKDSLIENGDVYAADQFYNEESDTLSLEEGFIENVVIGDPIHGVTYDGYKITSGVEGCGVDNYYFPINNSQTIVISVPFNLVFEYTNMYANEVLPNDLIAPDDSKQMLDGIFMTFKVL